MDRLLVWLRRSGWVYVAAAILLAALAWRIAPSGGDGGQPASTAPVSVARAERPSGALVHVAGAVRRPGVYRVAQGARVLAALRAAGGPTPRADLAALNLASRVQDGQQVVLPRRAPAGRGPAVGGGDRATGPISLGSATAEDLQRIDGIGPTIAGRIVEWRRQHGGFAAVEQLLEVPGIGEGWLEALRAQVVP